MHDHETERSEGTNLMAHILITGGTGTLGRQLVRQLCYQGLDVGILTRRKDVDLPSGAKVYAGDITSVDTIREAVGNASVIVHCASNPRQPTVDVEGTGNILQSIDRKAFRHFLYVSIAGVDRSRYPYYQAKHQVEKMVESSDVPWSVLRATQFHDLVLHRLIEPFDRGSGLSIKIPQGMRFQSVDVSDVANRLQQIAMSDCLRATITIGGPETLTIEDMVRTYLDVLGRNDDIEPTEVAGEFYDLFRSGVSATTISETGKIGWRGFLQNALQKR